MDTVAEKNFAWSYSRLKAFEDCPRRYYETQVCKDKWPEPKSEMLQWGDAVHKAMADSLRTGKPLPTVFHIYEPWLDKVRRTQGEMLVEDDCRWAITREFKPTPWFAKNVWLRCIADVVKLDEEVALVVDWKAGKSLNGDPIQLILTSLMMLLHFPKLKVVRSDFIWLQEDHQTTQVLYREEAPEYWAALMPRIAKLQKAVDADRFPPMPGRFCRNWCPVKSCEYHGK
jgi:hypothetical protein